MIELESMAVEMPEVVGHPNRVAFQGVLTVVDAASQKAPSGAKGHRVVLMRAAAEAALPSLLGMALDYAPSFDRHDQRRKVGVITSAEIIGRNLEVGGYLYAKDFPEVVEEVAKWGGRPEKLAASAGLLTTEDTEGHRGNQSPRPSVMTMQAAAEERARQGPGLRTTLGEAVARLRELIRGTCEKGRALGALRAETAKGAGLLGMSFELTDVVTADVRVRVWILTHVTFTGAAILRRNRAAYEGTWIELS